MTWSAYLVEKGFAFPVKGEPIEIISEFLRHFPLYPVVTNNVLCIVLEVIFSDIGAAAFLLAKIKHNKNEINHCI